MILRNLLPTPSGDVDLYDLLQFKNDYGHLLPRLRRSVESHCSIIATLPDAEDRLASAEDFIVRSKDSIDEITDAMKPTWQQVTLGSIVPLLGAGLSLSATETGNGVGYTGGALTLAGCAYQAISGIRGSRKDALRKPLAYVAHSNDKFLS